MKRAKYSIICYYDELLENDIENLYCHIESGLVVHLFLRGSFEEELSLNEYDSEDFKLAIKNNLLYLYEEQHDVYEDNIVIAVDDEIYEKEVYKKICNNKNIEFNHQQYDIITAPINSNIIVTSGAGTGKTTTMIERLIYLRKVYDEFTFDQAALITFTNKASREMKEKLLIKLEKYYEITKDIKYLDMMDEATKCSITTIHGLSKILINKYGKNIDINKNITIKTFKYKRSEAIIEAVNKIYNENNELYNLIKYYPLYELERKVLKIWEYLDNYSIDINSNEYNVLFGYDEKNFSILIKKIISYAQDKIDKEKENELEVHDLMKKLSDSRLFSSLTENIKLLMVDEFQDSDNIQIEFIAKFCKTLKCDLFVVGDEKQSIYRFRGAEHTAFKRLKELISSSAKKYIEFEMVRNYRTDASILEEIDDMFLNIGKKVEHFKYENEDRIYSLKNVGNSKKIEKVNLSELDIKKNFYSDMLNNKKENESVAVLFRSNEEIKDFKRFCDNNSILCKVEESGSFYRHEAVRDFYIMIKALIEENDNNILYSFIRTPYISGNIDKNIILNSFQDEICEYLVSILSKFKWDSYMDSVNSNNILVLIDKIIKELDPVKKYYLKTLHEAKKNQKEYKKIAYIKTLEYKINLEYLIYLLKEKFSENITTIFQIENFLKIKISTDDTVDTRKTEYENQYLQCLTVHKAKGLEYDYVVIHNLTKKFIVANKEVDVILRKEEDNVMVGYKVLMGKNDDEYNNNLYFKYLSDENEEIIGEETRLLYVAMTRCKSALYLNIDNDIAANTKINTWKSLVLGGEY